VPLPVPPLPTRTWSELVDESLSLVPRSAPGWTDHNVHDPGITLLELYAWLTEGVLFRADRVTPPMRRAFLRLLGTVPSPGGVASTVVTIRHDGPGATLPAGTVLSTATGIRFSTAARLALSPAWLELDPGEATERGVLAREHDGDVTDLGAANRADRPYLPFGESPSHGDALRIGFGVAPFAPGAPLELYAWADPPGAHAGDPPAAACCGPVTVWEYRSADGGWRAFEDVTDATGAFTRDGAVTLQAPAGPHVPGPDDGRFWIRCRFAAGAYDCPPRLARVAVNAVGARHAVAVAAERLGVSWGGAMQRYRLSRPPVVPGSTSLEGWSEVADWDRSGPYDDHYRLDPGEGVVEFGDGRRGRVPPDGLELRMAYATGGGETGNVRAGTLTRVEGADPGRLFQPFAATGGAAPETIDHAHGRALDRLAAATRAVTVEDVERLALSTPGVPVARARALAGHHPALPCVEARGVVTVVVLPACGEPPVPTRGLLDAVWRRLDARRPLATELHVVGPEYLDVTVEATLHAVRPAPPGLADAAADALRTYFDPLRGGPAGSGWPFGRAVIRTEVLAALAALPGVAFVDGLGLSGPGDAAPRCGDLALGPSQLVSLQPPWISVVEEDAE
jgi:predicted phage baseplate assembly protein